MEDPEVRDCDNSSTSGDCDFRDTGCGSTSFDVALVAGMGEDPDGEEDLVLVSLQKNRTTDDCQLVVCLACLADSGYAASGTNTSITSNTVVLNRRRRMSFFINGMYMSVTDLQISPVYIHIYPQPG